MTIRLSDSSTAPPGGGHASWNGVWEVVGVVRDNDGDTTAAADYIEIPLGLVQAAVTYYGDYAEEIDEWIDANTAEGERAHTAFLAGQAALGP